MGSAGMGGGPLIVGGSAKVEGDSIRASGRGFYCVLRVLHNIVMREKMEKMREFLLT